MSRAAAPLIGATALSWPTLARVPLRPPLPAGARHLRDVVRLSPASRRRPNGLVHIESPPWVLDGVRLDFTTEALCGTGLAGVYDRRIGVRTDATCRRCRNAARHVDKATRMVWPLWVAERGLGRPVPEQALGWPPEQEWAGSISLLRVDPTRA